MNSSLENKGFPNKSQQDTYSERFLFHVHCLLEKGYLTIGKDDYTDATEETISGDMRESIENILDQSKESWMKFYHVDNEKPVQQSWLPKAKRTRKGKKRQRIDLELSSSEATPRRRFSIEAKLLRNSHSVSAYTGKEGVGCFINGEYARDETTAGMLGFIQNRSESEWIDNIGKKLNDEKSSLKLTSNPVWKETGQTVGSIPVKTSSHRRKDDLPNIDLYHTFLNFT